MKEDSTFRYRKAEDDEQAEWCMEWSRKNMQKKIRRVQHWCNFKVYLKHAWYEFKAAVKGR